MSEKKQRKWISKNVIRNTWPAAQSVCVCLIGYVMVASMAPAVPPVLMASLIAVIAVMSILIALSMIEWAEV